MILETHSLAEFQATTLVVGRAQLLLAEHSVFSLISHLNYTTPILKQASYGVGVELHAAMTVAEPGIEGQEPAFDEEALKALHAQYQDWDSDNSRTWRSTVSEPRSSSERVTARLGKYSTHYALAAYNRPFIAAALRRQDNRRRG